MNFYDDLVMQTQMNYSRHYPIYASGSTPYQLTDKKPLPYSEQIHRLVQEVKEADCVVVGGASGLSAAGGGDFYYEDNDSYRKYFRPFAEKYHFKGAFAGMMHPWKTREEYWGYLATFLHTTQTAPVRHSYLDLDALLKGKDFFILTTNQDTQFVKLYPEEKVAEIQGLRVLNINDLANALKQSVLPGEELQIYLAKEGKEPGQAIGYLDDGTMVVVEGGKRCVNVTVPVTVTSVLQTSAGRMIFAKLK